MTRITGSQILKTPCCGKTLKSVAYGTINFSTDENWTDGKAVGALFNSDGQLRKCLCGRPFFLNDAYTGVVIKNDDAILSADSIPSALYISDSEIKDLLVNKMDVEIEIALRKRLWRLSNDEFREEYRQHMQSKPCDLPNYVLTKEQEENLEILKILLVKQGGANELLLAELDRALGNREDALSHLSRVTNKNDVKLAEMLAGLIYKNYRGPVRYKSN
jgi:hypothetical protein